MTVRVGIDGFGRIGRNLFRAANERGVDIDFVAVNDLGGSTRWPTCSSTSILGVLPDDQGDEGRHQGRRRRDQGAVVRNPTELPWGDLGVDLVVESTGLFTARDKAAMHLEAGAPLVVVCAGPAPAPCS